MEFINKIFELDLGKFVPEMDLVLDKARLLVTVSVLAGPILLLVLGLIYCFIPPKEANHRFGFRTYFGMGSVEAWRFTQRIGGITFGGLGLILLVIMLFVIGGFDAKDHFEMVNSAMLALLWQAGLALAARLAVAVLAAVFFDRKGNRRKSNTKRAR